MKFKSGRNTNKIFIRNLFMLFTVSSFFSYTSFNQQCIFLMSSRVFLSQ